MLFGLLHGYTCSPWARLDGDRQAPMPLQWWEKPMTFGAPQDFAEMLFQAALNHFRNGLPNAKRGGTNLSFPRQGAPSLKVPVTELLPKLGQSIVYEGLSIIVPTGEDIERLIEHDYLGIDSRREHLRGFMAKVMNVNVAEISWPQDQPFE